MNRFFVSCAVLGLNLILAHPVYPWGDTGHEVFGHIAQRNLTDKALEQVMAILRPKSSVNEALAKAAIWPDHEGEKIKDMDSLHYVNFTAEESYYIRARNCPRRNCIVEAIRWYRRVMVDEEAPLNLRRIALRFLAHLVGDIHMPLHAGHRKDRGGTDIYVNYRGARVRLHKLWDAKTKIIELKEQGSSAEIAVRLDEGVTPNERQAWKGGTAAAWAEESLKLARTYAYKVAETGIITDEYVRRALPVIRQRLAQGGIRLAWILNEDFK
jgi:hypothetical protein